LQKELIPVEIIGRLNLLEQTFIAYTKDTNLELQEHDKKINEIFKCLEYLVDINKPSQIDFITND